MMELVEIARGHVRVKDQDRSFTIYGEAFLRGHGSPDFLLYENSITRWDPPHEHEAVSTTKKVSLLQFLQDEFSRRNMTLEIN
jgi:hypothetical protein